MKPFIKPRSAAGEARQPTAPQISPSELTIFSVAASFTDPSERAAYLDRACGHDGALRTRLEERLIAREPRLSPTPAPSTSAEVVASARETALTTKETALATKDRPDAVALVPMSAMQLAASQQPPRHSPIPWALATLLAVGLGAVGVFFWFEREARAAAEQQANAAEVARTEAERERQAAAAEALEARTVAERSSSSREKAETDKAAAEAAAAQAKTLAEQRRAELAQVQAAAQLAAEKAKTAEAEVAKLRQEAAAGQRITALALAESLAQLGGLQIDARAYAEAEKNVRQSLAIRQNAGADGWAILESRALLGSILFQRNQDAEAQQEFLAAATAIETLGPPGNDADRARVSAASKRIVQFFNVTGRRREASEWRRRLDAVLAAR